MGYMNSAQIDKKFKAEAIPSYPFILTFHNLTYNVKCSKKAASFTNEYPKKMLLDNISGQAREGQITAVLGASGSGKSTLIDALAGRISKQSLEGSVTLNGEEVLQCNTNVLKSLAAYVMQDDLLFPMLTVEETLMFSAELRLPRTMSKLQKRQRVQDIILQLGLGDAAKTMIGDEGHRGVSGGERRRVSIGLDVIHGPIILFLDEPTSGMDSSNAFLVVRVLQSIARNGSIVILAIHQPSSRILSLIDHLLILSDGQMVYTGSSSGLTDFFSALDHPIPEDENAAEFALDFISELRGSSAGTSSFVEFNKTWQMREIPQDIDRNLSGMMSLKDAVFSRITAGKLFTSAVIGSSFANPIWVEIRVISKRSVMNSTRMPESFLFRFGAVGLAGVMLATIFWKLDDSPRGAQERLGFFASAITTSFFICAEAIPYIVQERSMFRKETAYNSYRTSSYVLSQAITALPSMIILALTFSTLTFWSVGLDGGFWGFMWFFSFMVASFWVGHSFVTFICAVAPHIMVSYVMVVSLLAQSMLLSGLFISRDRIPRYWIWFHYMSLVKYPYQGVLQNEFDNHPVKCFVTGIQMFDNTPLRGASNALKIKVLESMTNTVGISITSSCVTTGPDILQQQGATDLSKLQCLLITVAWGFLFRILFYAVLLYGYKGKRT